SVNCSRMNFTLRSFASFRISSRVKPAILLRSLLAGWVYPGVVRGFPGGPGFPWVLQGRWCRHAGVVRPAHRWAAPQPAGSVGVQEFYGSYYFGPWADRKGEFAKYTTTISHRPRPKCGVNSPPGR